MDDHDDHVCPLCCEELDLSDRQFYPCKCGYQVCMWCWHRIRESESGLCPACRTPYGDDPHEFSAVDVEDVLKANKEKAAAEKRLKQQQQQQQHHDGDVSSDGEAPEPPKDRTQLANMRVIRRNLVYSVGLPPSIANEETLRKSEYFGQYGKVSKIVLNRTHATSSSTGGGDARRASASAYVTFLHKEDTLACILALDGFFLDGRNVRASYGTSKYCSAFIKNVRCNNPECTYLHHMGAAEDTFTKQEIQAGYVTSGRDVLARQQQIVAQALSAASSGGTRRKVGGGGPSGTGKASSNPVFPPPAYDEPQKPSSLVPQQPLARAVTTTGFPVASLSSNGAKIGRSVSMSSEPVPAAPMRRASVGGGVSAASVVAGVHNAAPTTEAPAPHTTLTSLTPLKRQSKTAGRSSSTSAIGASFSHDSSDSNRLASPKMDKPNSSKNHQHLPTFRKVSGTAATSPSSSNSSLTNNNDSSVGSLGGTIIGAAPIGSNGGAAVGAIGSAFGSRTGAIGSGGFGGQPIGAADFGRRSTSHGGGEIFSGNQKDKWGAAGGEIGGRGLWEAPAPAPIGASLSGNSGSLGIIGGSSSNGLGSIGSALGAHSSESSALASMLGISLPSGSGSLRESSPAFGPPSQQHAVGGRQSAGVIGRGGVHQAPIGGHVIGMPSRGVPGSAPQPIGNKNDVALLQSLLPGVHITSGNAQQPAASAGGWNPLQSSDGGLDTWGVGASGRGGSMLGPNNGGQKQGQHQSSSSIW